MKHILVLTCIAIAFSTHAQTPVALASLSNYTYTETFADIANWTFSISPADGTFTSGIGAAAWKGNAGGGTGTIPSGNVVTGNTTFFQASTNTGSSTGLYRGSQNINLLATGTTNNTNAVAFDLYVNFSTLNAGTLSFDWASVSNSTGDRKGSLKVFASADGTTFTEITAAAVLNITNNSPTSGSISFVALPASLNNVSSAIIRFYYYNGTGGTTGSRPRMQLDNIKVTGVPATACTTPSAQPSAFNATAGYNSISASFTAANPAPQQYLIIKSVNQSLSSLPVNGVHYAADDNIGDGSVVAVTTTPSFTATNLTPSTTYNFFIFSMNGLCSGGPLYQTANALTGSATTLSGSEPCLAPSAQPSNLVLSNSTNTSISGSFTAAAGADRYLIVRSTNANLTANPVNGTQYYASSNLGGGTVVTKTPLTSFTANGLNSGTQYYFFVFAVREDNCTNGPAYNIVNPAKANATTTVTPTCVAPALQPSGLNLIANNNAINGYFTPATADGYLVLYSSSSTLSALPQNNTVYTVGTAIGNATVLSNSNATAFSLNNISAGSTYYFYVFAKNDQCSGGVKYLTTAPLQGNTTTTATAVANIYYGNLHAHSAYSDGNKDNTSYTPADGYAYAKNSLCMDFLGISEHNHSDAGMLLSRWQPGLNQAAAATTSNFLALYGIEWGVISNGGHVLVYGPDQLIGWEPNNYNIFVAKSDYVGNAGLFRTINNMSGTNVVMLAHPDLSDFNNIAGQPVIAVADSAISGCAVESGPAFSTNSSYSDPGSKLAYYYYYKKLLAKGYHVGPTIDHDNHYTVFGRTAYSRLAVISPSLTKSDFLQAVKNRRFYATHNCNAKANFTLNNQPMGSIVSGTTAPAISVYAFDPTNASATVKIKIMYGVPGSAIDPVVIDSATGNTYNFTDYNLAAGATAYYYAEITIGGGSVITSPIWYTRTGTVTPVQFISLTADAVNGKSVSVNWITANEINNKYFVVEKSLDGISFKPLGNVDAKGSVTVNNSYQFIDDKAVNGLNYYRIKQVDNDGRFSYSNVVAVNLATAAVNSLRIFPNPVQQKLTLTVKSDKNVYADITIADAYGRVVNRFAQHLNKGTQQLYMNVSQLTSGTYFVMMNTGSEQFTERFIKQ